MWATSGWLPPATLSAQLKAIVAARMPSHLPRIRWVPDRPLLLGVALLTAVAAAWSGVLFIRGHSHQVTSPAPAAMPQPVVVPPLPTATASNVAPALVVDIEGKVAQPGVLHLPAGSRLFEALAAAGGVLPGADTTSLDLARLLVDGEQVRVDLPGAAVGPVAVPGASSAPTGPVNLNSATLDALDALPGVGPVTAQHILDWRTQHGRFTSVGQLHEVPGIGPATYERLAPLVTV